MAGCDESEQHQRFRRLRHNPVPEFKEWQVWEGDIKSGYFYSEDLRGVRAELLAEGHQPRVSMRGLCEWSALPGRTQPGPAAGKAGGHPEPAGPANHSTTLESRFCRYVYQNYTQAAASRLPAAEVGSRPTLPGHRCVPLPKERPGQRSLPPARLLSAGLHRPRGGGQAGGSHVGDLPCDHRKGVRRQGLVRQAHLRKWSLDATAHVDQQCLEQVLQRMEHNWPEGEEHYAKLAINSLVGLFARNLELVCSMKTSGEGCSWRQTFTDAAERSIGTTSL